MNLLNVLGFSVALGADAMSVSAAIGVKWHGRGQRLRLATHMGLFQFAMPILGWLAGRELADLIRGVGKYVAAGLVFLIGAKMLYEAIKSHPGATAEHTEEFVEHELHVHPKDPTRGWSLWVLAIATSLDALVVGLSLGLRGESAIWLASVVIGIVAAAMSLAGVMIGKKAGAAFGKPAECAGALVLIGLAVSFLFM